ncbi:IclR family transcriptional regulator [Ruicaihuangia caeni]|uniref:IclR family transcriptional regulator n=1 Tax=Ruicaihuangia caeni TaxID=3042517 RepID=UPI00338FB630
MAGDLGLVQKTVHIVRIIASNAQGIGLSDLSRDSGISKATCHRILSALEREGWLVSDAETRRVRLSLDLAFMIDGLRTDGSVLEYTKEVLRELTEATRETSGLDRLSGASVVVLAQVPGPHIIGHAPRPVPRTLNAWRTSTGRALLAWNDAEPLKETIEADLSTPPATRFHSFDEVRAELEQVRIRGYAYTRDELEDGLTAVAAPVRVGDQVPYAVWISGPSYRVTEDVLPVVAESVMDAANRLGRLLSTGSGVSLGMTNPVFAG